MPYEDVETFQPSRLAAKNMMFTYVEIPEVLDACERALKQVEEGDLSGAQKVAQELFRSHPDDHSVNYLLGVCSGMEGNYHDSIGYFEKALQICPILSEAYFNLANSYLKTIQVPKAVDCFKRVIEIEGKNGDLGKMAQEQIDELADMIQRSSGLSLDEHLQLEKLFNRAFDGLKKRQYQKAILLFQKVLAIDPAHVQSYGNIGLAYSGLGKNKLALECLDKALELDPGYEPARSNRILVAALGEGKCMPGIVNEVRYYESGMG